jgi:serpin B
MNHSQYFKISALSFAGLLALGISTLSPAQGNPSAPRAALPQAAASGSVQATKDILIDSPVKPNAANVAPGNSAASGVLVPTPGARPGSSVSGTLVPTATAVPAQARMPERRYTSAAHDVATAGALAELALDLMREQSNASGNAQVNAVVSPLSLAAVLGMVHAGTAGASARELASLLGQSSAGERVYTARLPVLLDRLAAPGAVGSPFVMANRVWLDNGVAANVPSSYAATVTDRFNADAAVLQFAQSAAARKSINTWVSQKTAKRIPELMPEGSITANTKMVVTNAIHFKSKWAEPFDASQTTPMPFQVMSGAPKNVPTMVDERQVRQGTINNNTVIELPFAGNDYSLLIAMAPAGHTLNALEQDLDGLDLAGWSAQLKASTCRLSLPKFSIEPAVKSLKTSLQAMGVKTVFSPDADFEPMLGKAAKGVQLDNVYQSATIIIDEQGGEAAAATGASASSKSFSLPAPACAVDRPFVFAVMHRPTGAPLFVGKIADPSQR